MTTQEAVEIVLEHNADALCCQGVADVVVLVVVAIVGFKSEVAVFGKEVFDVEVADKVVAVHCVVGVSEVAVEQQTVVEQSARQGELDFDVGEVAFVGVEVRRNRPVVVDLTEHTCQLARTGRRSHRCQFVGATGSAHIFRRIESTEREQIENLLECDSIYQQ